MQITPPEQNCSTPIESKFKPQYQVTKLQNTRIHTKLGLFKELCKQKEPWVWINENIRHKGTGYERRSQAIHTERSCCRMAAVKERYRKFSPHNKRWNPKPQIPCAANNAQGKGFTYLINQSGYRNGVGKEVRGREHATLGRRTSTSQNCSENLTHYERGCAGRGTHKCK